mmetsp:Transcript_5814/g.7323  ORF Transcript_5814/g.7323 Transcript_5814/m.7323 type:complete len:238 (+) Transcript_5814:795-1508(+)
MGRTTTPPPPRQLRRTRRRILPRGNIQRQRTQILGPKLGTNVGTKRHLGRHSLAQTRRLSRWEHRHSPRRQRHNDGGRRPPCPGRRGRRHHGIQSRRKGVGRMFIRDRRVARSRRGGGWACPGVDGRGRDEGDGRFESGGARCHCRWFGQAGFFRVGVRRGRGCGEDVEHVEDGDGGCYGYLWLSIDRGCDGESCDSSSEWWFGGALYSVVAVKYSLYFISQRIWDGDAGLCIIFLR